MATTRKAKSSRTTKKDLEERIHTLEAQIAKLSAQAPPKPEPSSTRGSLPKGTAQKQQTAPPPKPAPQPSSARGSLPKGMSPPSQQQQQTAPPPKPAPQPSSTRGSLPKGMAPPPQTASAETSAPPATVAAALEESYRNFPITDTFGEMRAKITGYTPSPSRYYARNTAPTGKVATSDWNLQKKNVTGYTQPSNQYFATRQRLAYHPPEKRFTGYGMRVDEAGTQDSAPPPPPPPSSTHGSLPKGMSPPPQQQQQQAQQGGSSKSNLESYEEDYLKRLEKEQAERAELERLARENAQKRTAPAPSSTHGTLPKGF